MGNRGGRIHRDDRTLGARRWASRQWIICVLAFKGRQRQVMGSGYTELFFLDEVTALAAGHRPCFECQRARALDYARAFPGEGRTPAPDMDAALHRDRLGPPEHTRADALPDGAMFAMDGAFWARRRDLVLRWTPEGYVAPRAVPAMAVRVLTPAPTLAVLAAGYAPDWHKSALALAI